MKDEKKEINDVKEFHYDLTSFATVSFIFNGTQFDFNNYDVFFEKYKIGIISKEKFILANIFKSQILLELVSLYFYLEY